MLFLFDITSTVCYSFGFLREGASLSPLFLGCVSVCCYYNCYVVGCFGVSKCCRILHLTLGFVFGYCDSHSSCPLCERPYPSPPFRMLGFTTIIVLIIVLSTSYVLIWVQIVLVLSIMVATFYVIRLADILILLLTIVVTIMSFLAVSLLRLVVSSVWLLIICVLVLFRCLIVWMVVIWVLRTYFLLFICTIHVLTMLVRNTLILCASTCCLLLVLVLRSTIYFVLL